MRRGVGRVSTCTAVVGILITTRRASRNMRCAPGITIPFTVTMSPSGPR